MDGKYFEGTAYWQPEEFANGKAVDSVFSEDEWPFKLVNCKAKLRSVSMLSNAPVLTDLSPKNFIEVNTLDAQALGLKTGDQVKLISATGGSLTGKLLVRKGIARGTAAVGFGYGHWAYGAQGYQIGSRKYEGDKSREGGIMAGQVSPLDTFFEKVFGLSDVSVGIPARNGGRYKIVRI
ncbi:MAG: molybdopterin dinucleotide binding domain-containing protein [Bacillota bacterium]